MNEKYFKQFEDNGMKKHIIIIYCFFNNFFGYHLLVVYNLQKAIEHITTNQLHIVKGIGLIVNTLEGIYEEN